jgi:predicted  nucleic acid-binding Zn-ribbon protein
MNSSEDKAENKINSAKDKYVEKQKAEIDKWNDDIEDLNAKITVADADNEAKLEHKANIAALRQKRDEARAKLTEIEEADDDGWEGLKDGLENIWTNIKYGFEKVKAKF